MLRVNRDELGKEGEKVSKREGEEGKVFFLGGGGEWC